VEEKLCSEIGLASSSWWQLEPISGVINGEFYGVTFPLLRLVSKKMTHRYVTFIAKYICFHRRMMVAFG
jgi:hypothetical protein